MRRHVLLLITLTALMVMPFASAIADGFCHGQGFGISHKRGHGSRHGHGSGRGHGFHHGGKGFGAGFVSGFNCDFGWDLAELYRELLDNVPYYALHPPVYYSYPVPRPYGYSPFAYPGYVMTPETACQPQPLEIINPHVPAKPKPASVESDRAASAAEMPQPLVILNPFVPANSAVAQSAR